MSLGGRRCLCECFLRAAELRALAYREVLQFKRGVAGLVAFRARLEGAALGINRQFPKPLGPPEALSPPGQPVWAAIEPTQINNPSRRPSPQDIRSEVWMKSCVEHCAD